MSAHDRWLANYSAQPVSVKCLVCHEEWEDTYESEYGAGWLSGHEDCPECGAFGESLAIGESSYEPDFERDDWGEEYGQYDPWDSDRPV